MIQFFFSVTKVFSIQEKAKMKKVRSCRTWRNSENSKNGVQLQEIEILFRIDSDILTFFSIVYQTMLPWETIFAGFEKWKFVDSFSSVSQVNGTIESLLVWMVRSGNCRFRWSNKSFDRLTKTVLIPKFRFSVSIKIKQPCLLRHGKN